MATGSISSIGIGSGLDAENIVSQLVAIKKKSLSKLETQAITVNAKISAMGSLKTAVSNLQDQVTKLTSGSLWNGKTFSSSLSSAVSGSVTEKAVAGTYSVAVSQLAASQNVNSEAFTKDAGMGKGVLTITMGAWSSDGTTFTDAAETNKNLVLDDLTGDETLSQIAAKINAKKAGVTATIVRDASGERLSITSTATGVGNGFRVDVAASGAEPIGANLAKLAYYPGATGTMTQSRAAQDTLATINGIAVSSANQTFSDVADGLTLTVSQITEAGKPATITIAQDLASAKKAVENFATSYSSLMETLSTMMAYNKETGEAGTLQGDAMARSLQSAMRRMLQNVGGANSSFSSLSQIGLELQKDGSLKVNDSKLTDALKDPENMRNFLSVDEPGTDNDGWAVRALTFTKGLLDVTEGMFATADSSLKARLKTNAEQQTLMNRRISAYEDNLRKTYSALDSKMAQLDALNNYVSQQVAQWNKSRD
ncbi:MAG: flagellar filament capping protein FliD [Comamonas sp.]